MTSVTFDLPRQSILAPAIPVNVDRVAYTAPSAK
jgi:hypothetical protein